MCGKAMAMRGCLCGEMVAGASRGRWDVGTESMAGTLQGKGR